MYVYVYVQHLNVYYYVDLYINKFHLIVKLYIMASNEGSSHALRSSAQTSYIPNSSSMVGGGTYTSSTNEPGISDYENVFGPSARDIKEDLQRYKRHGRWHLPDILKGPNPWLADRVDGLITDAASSPFTSTILPYKYFDNVDGKLNWNVWSFDEAMPSRVPYEAAARTLTQTKRSFSAYAVRSGLAITLEHNFMMTPEGRKNFQDQLNQLVGSIQYANDLDVHMALILAPSHEKHMAEKYNNFNKTSAQICREYVDLFGFMQKNQNGLDILIEEAKLKLKLWGGPMPNFLLTNSKLTFQLQMNPERTNFISQGIDGVKRLRQGPDLTSYRGVSVIPSRSFSMENGQPPRDMLRRRVRVAEYYRIVGNKNSQNCVYELYNEERDTFFNITWNDLFKFAQIKAEEGNAAEKRHEILINTNMQPAPQLLHPGRRNPLALLNKCVSMNEHGNNWMHMLNIVGTSDNQNTVVIPEKKMVASFVQPDLVFVPFVENLHYNVEMDLKVPFTQCHTVPSYLSSYVQNSLAPYPRITDIPAVPHTLKNPCTLQTYTRGSVDYNESRILLTRLFRRYAAPANFIKKNGTDLTFNTQCLASEAFDVHEMFYQPLGAHNEPNHPQFYENMLMGGARNVHSDWILTEDVLDLLMLKPDRWAMAAQVASKMDGKNMSKAEFSIAVNEQIQMECLQKGWEKTPRLAEKHAVYTWGRVIITF